jgi:hypothetical protein
VSEFAWNCSFRRLATRAPSLTNIRVGPGVELLAIEGDAPAAERDFGERRANLGVEAVAVDAEVGWRVAVTEDRKSVV